MKQFKKDILHWKDYDFTIVNDKIELCYNQILNFIKKQKQNSIKLSYDKKNIKNHINNLIS